MSVTVNTYNPAMARWAPNTKDRLAQAAMQLYHQRGYPQTTVVEIAAQAGTTERTFFRHFADKSEVLFGGAAELQERVVNAIQQVPADVPPLPAVAAGFEVAQHYFHGDPQPFQRRQDLIGSHPELYSRELHKLSSLSNAISDALHSRGVSDPAARLAAEAGVVIFKAAFELWLSGEEPDWAQCIQQTLTALQDVAGAEVL